MFELMKHLWSKAGSSGLTWQTHALWLARGMGDAGCSVCARMRKILDTHPKII